MRRFGRFPDLSFEDLARPAVEAALKDAGVPFRDIQTAFCGVVNSGLYDSRRVIQQFGWTGIPIHSVVQASGSSAAAFRLAYWTVGSGLFETALIVGYEKMPKGMLRGTVSPGRSHLDVMGLDPIPGRVALEMKKRMERFGESPEMYAAVAAQASWYAARNGHAHYQEEHSIEDVLNSSMIADPLTMYMCCPVSDGASAVVIASKEWAERGDLDRAVTIAGSICASPEVEDLVGGPGADIGGDFKAGNLTRKLSHRLYESVGIGPEDIDVAQVHDPFTMATLVAVEALGFCPAGEGGRFVAEGNIGPTGRVPTNTDGGLLCKGHPMGATGTAQITEIVKQLRGEAGDRQVANPPSVGLAQNSGAGLINIHVLKR